MTPPALTALQSRLAWIHDLNAASAVLEWDQETYMPEGGARARAYQISTLRRLAHEAFVDVETGRLLDAAEAEAPALDPSSPAHDLTRVTRRDFEKATRVPAALVAERAETSSLAQQAWKEARDRNRFSDFAPFLEKLVRLEVARAEHLGYPDHPYDALLDLYEPGLTTAEVSRVFTPLREQLLPLVQHVREAPGPDDSFLHRPFDVQQQWRFGMEVLADLGFSFERGRQDRSAHPFTTTFSSSDVRLTTRLDEHFFPTAFFGTLHEGGHGLYEQGVDPAYDRSPLAEGASLGMHESQSRLWENLVGRSHAFWEHYYPRLQDLFPEALRSVSLDAFQAAINRAEPSLLRVEADEVTYNLHIMLRFALEVELVEGRTAVADLPARWNDLSEELLGLRPPDDATGVLQDVHWALGAIGYFPTYTLGTLMSVQLFEAAQRDLGDLHADFRTGQFAPLLGWLRTHVHRHGRARTAPEILRDSTGHDLDAKPWLRYVYEKYRAPLPADLLPATP